MMHQIEEHCTLGVHASIIIPPAWMIKLPRKVPVRGCVRPTVWYVPEYDGARGMLGVVRVCGVSTFTYDVVLVYAR